MAAEYDQGHVFIGGPYESRGGALSHQIREELCFQLFQIMIKPKQTEDQPKMFDKDHILVFSENSALFRFVFGLIRNSSVCFGCFDIGSKHRNKPKILVFGFTKQTETQPKQILFRLFRFEPKIFFFRFEDTLTYCTRVRDIKKLFTRAKSLFHEDILHRCLLDSSTPVAKFHT
jgi:hypothetical protein